MARCYPVTVGEISPLDERLDTSQVGSSPPFGVMLLDDWGDGATITLSQGSDDNRGRVTIVTGTTAVAVNPRWQLTFSNFWTPPSPSGIVSREDAARSPSWDFSTVGPQSFLTVTQGGAIATTTTIVYDYIVIG